MTQPTEPKTPATPGFPGKQPRRHKAARSRRLTAPAVLDWQERDRPHAGSDPDRRLVDMTASDLESIVRLRLGWDSPAVSGDTVDGNQACRDDSPSASRKNEARTAFHPSG